MNTVYVIGGLIVGIFILLLAYPIKIKIDKNKVDHD